MSIFKKIIEGEIPADRIYEDDLCLAFRDIRPQAPIHLLLIPKEEIPGVQFISDSNSQLMGHLMTRIPLIAAQEGIDEGGYRLVINQGEDGGQEVPHLHIHILAGRSMKWPPG